MEKLVTVSQWLRLSSPERLMFREVFGIPRSSGTISLDGKLSSDGHTENDLKHINIGSMQDFLDTESINFYELFDLSVEKIKKLVNDRLKQTEDVEKEENRKQQEEQYGKVVESILSSIKLLPLEFQFDVKRKLDVSLTFGDAVVADKVEDEPIKSEVKQKKTYVKRK